MTSYDIIGDVHGCFDELRELLQKLGYQIKIEKKGLQKYTVWHPENRKILFVGDLVDRGPKNAECLQLAMDLKDSEMALFVSGNHDDKLLEKLLGEEVYGMQGLEITLKELEQQSKEWMERLLRFLKDLPPYLVLDGGQLLVVHAGYLEMYRDQEKEEARNFLIHGLTPKGEIAEFWYQDYAGFPFVVYGHYPYKEPRVTEKTAGIDTGCVFGGALTCLRYPEKNFVQVKARKA